MRIENRLQGTSKGEIDLNVDKGKAFSTEVINRKSRGKSSTRYSGTGREFDCSIYCKKQHLLGTAAMPHN